MKFIVSSQVLLKQLQSIGGVLNSSNTLPILDNFLFEIQDQKLTISCSDLESTMTSTISIDAKSEGSIAIPAKMLLDILKTFPNHPLTFSIDDKMGVEISSDYGKYKLSGYSGTEFPKSPVIEAPSTVTISSHIFQRAIEKTIFASGNDDLRPVMSGIFVQLSESDLTFVATDAHKLVRYTRNDVKSSAAASFIVPKKPMNLLKGLLQNFEGEVTIKYNESNASIAFNDILLTCRLVDGKYPNYDAVIPKENPNRLTVDRNAFFQSIKRVSIFANKTTHQVRLKINGSELNISAEDVDFSNEANERLTCSYQGESIEIGFNSRFLNEMLQNIDSDNVIFELSAPNRAGILIPDNSENGEDILMLVMPVMLNS
jgi:DNA polymerase-3 subunit beta